jgi:REP element-mobilizing transposase RayT
MNSQCTPKDHKHLHRLSRIWVSNPRYFITVCVEQRRSLLATGPAAGILLDEWNDAVGRHGWAVGSYCIMPDHVHFFCTNGESETPLSVFVGNWKQWTAKKLKRSAGLDGTVWQKGFFDHLLRSSESYSQKWDYVRNNPVRAGLVEKSEDWPFLGHVHYL